MDPLEAVNTAVDAIATEIDARQKMCAEVPGLFYDLLGTLIWAGDEITQLREDLHGTMGAVVSLTDENDGLAKELERYYSDEADALTQRLAHLRSVKWS